MHGRPSTLSQQGNDMSIIIFTDYVTKEEIFLRTMEHVPRKDDVIILYNPTSITEYYVYQVRWDMQPNALPTIYVDLAKIRTIDNEND